MNLDQLVLEIAQKARRASLEIATLSSDAKNNALRSIADLIEQNQKALLEENAKDIEAGEKNNLSQALLDRLRFNAERITGMATGVRELIDLPNPVGEIIEKNVRPNGLDIRKVRVPIGVIGIIYESRPNVTIDCAALCLKSGNASILRGGKEAFHTNTALAKIIEQALEENNIDTAAVQLIPTTDRSALNTLLKLDQYVHCIIPRGGEGLIRFVAENANMPVIKHYKGVCNVYVDKDADLELAQKLVINSKCQRPGVCNAAENLFIHQDIANTFLPQITKALIQEGVEIRTDEKASAIAESNNIAYTPATEEDFHEEYLDKIIAIKIVPDLSGAIDAVNTYGSAHSDAIITKDDRAAQIFLNAVDTSTAYWNASTRFTDGFEFGLGAEIGISTDKLHARGPMGLKELCTYKFMVYGTGQVK